MAQADGNRIQGDASGYESISKNDKPLLPAGGFYDTLRREVQQLLKRDTKGTPLQWVQLFLETGIWLALWYLAVTSSSTIVTLVCSFLAGMVLMGLGFTGMHDASHSAISFNPKINDSVSFLWNSLLWWNHYCWFVHHVFGHHGYTGDYDNDPDLKHFDFACRKHKKFGWKNIYKYQRYFAFLVDYVLPGYMNGTRILYQYYGRMTGKVYQHLLPLLTKPTPLEWALYVFQLAVISAPFLAGKGFWLSFVMVSIYNLGLSFCFYANVAPNHDTATTRHLENNTNPDWGARQVLNSGDFWPTGSWQAKYWAYLFGGMNFQIEHHLFPTLGHRHYHLVAPLVKKNSQKYNISYTVHDTWFGAVKDVALLLKELSVKTAE